MAGCRDKYKITVQNNKIPPNGSTKLLNDIGKDILKDRLSTNRFGEDKDFSIVFIGDSHVGMKGSGCEGNTPLKKYTGLLDKINSLGNSQNILCIVHGGDGTHYGCSNLIDFAIATRNELYSGNIKKGDQIPLFMTEGNHEYKTNDSDTKIDSNNLQYTTVIANPQPGSIQMVTLLPKKLRLALLNTGYYNNGSFELGNQYEFFSQVNDLGTKMKNSPKGERFIIDMHIPPRIDNNLPEKVNPNKRPHVLNKEFTDYLTNMINYGENQYKISTIVSHHRHCKYLPGGGSIPYVVSKGSVTTNTNIPVFITAYGGHCYPDKDRPTCAAWKTGHPYQCLILYFNWVYLQGSSTIKRINLKNYNIINIT